MAADQAIGRVEILFLYPQWLTPFFFTHLTSRSFCRSRSGLLCHASGTLPCLISSPCADCIPWALVKDSVNDLATTGFQALGVEGGIKHLEQLFNNLCLRSRSLNNDTVVASGIESITPKPTSQKSRGH